nr:ATP-grasp domain-containing protein [uncultured Limnohabitans sp.]
MRVVLLGAAGTGTAFAIATRLRSSWGGDIKIVLTDVNDEHLISASILADAFYKVPAAKDPIFRERIMEILQTEKVTTYIPILNDELVLAAELAKIEAYKNIDFWSSDIYAACVDKDFADKWLCTIGVRTPDVATAQQLQEADRVWFTKPRNGFGSKGVGYLTSAEVMALSETDRKELLIQEVCTSPEVTVDSFWDFEKNNGYAYCRERIEIKSGVCTKARLFYDAELSNFAKLIGQALRQKGIICFQAMRSTRGWVVTDLNLRSGAGTAMTCAAGFDVLSAAFACRSKLDYSKYLKSIELTDEIYVTRQYAEFVMVSKK